MAPPDSPETRHRLTRTHTDGTSHQMFEIDEFVQGERGVRGWFRVSNDGVVKSIWVEQPDGSRRLFLPYKESQSPLDYEVRLE